MHPFAWLKRLRDRQAKAADAIGGMTELARRTGLTRETIYKALGSNGNPRFFSLLAIVHAFGLELGVRKQKTA